MKHYAIEQWTDFVRGLVGEAERADMENHLKRECTRCRRLTELLGTVRESQDRFEVPDDVLNRARAIFPRPPATRESPIRRLVAALQFDIQSAFAPAGVRSGSPGVRRLAFGVEDLVIELLVEPEAKRRTVMVTGQVSAGGQSGSQVAHRVRLLAKREVVVETVSTAFGEFHMEFPRRTGLRLLITEENTRREIEVPMDVVLGARNVPKSGPKTKSEPSEGL